MKAVILLLLLNTRYFLLNGEKSGIITHCQWYNRYDMDVGVTFSCNDSPNKVNSEKNHQNYFNDVDGVECFNINGVGRFNNKHMIDAIRFNNCRMSHVPRNTFKAYPYLRLLDISQLSLDSLQPEHLVGARRTWELFVSNNELVEIPAFLFVNAGSVTKVDFSFNKIRRIDAQAFIDANELTMIDLSRNKIDVLNERTFRGLVNLTHMNLAYNEINEIDASAFAGLKRLYHLDLSHNAIAILKDRTFANLSKLNRLQLSYNQINQIEPYAFATAHSLVRLDLSHNNITDEQIFDNLFNLLHLDLSHNPINELGIGTFASLIKLEHLNLAHTNLTNIELGTFSYQRGLISLDLSENNLKSLDFGMFLPAFRYLELLYIDGNQLTDMEGFTNKLFPRLNSLGITNNHFNCTYLKRFMRLVEWDQIRLPVDRMPLNIHQTNIRGVACDSTELNDIENITKNQITRLNNEQNNAELNDAVETLIRHLPAPQRDENDSDVKVVKLQRRNGSKIMLLVW